ncbi:MAG TPA: hypothetical protein DCS93_11825 [Microscillaceae bacterium]|nr:hypothetical protein [Microscillaceae bacterium]
MFRFNYIRVVAGLVITCLITNCSLFEKEFIFPSPIAQQASDIGVAGFTAHWEKVLGATSYEIDVTLDSNFTQFVSGYQDKQVEDTSLIIDALEPSTTYYYRVRANISSQTSINSNIIQVVTESLTQPLVYAATEVSSTGFRIHWQKMPIATNYLIDVAADENFQNTLINYNSLRVSPPDTHLLINNVKVNTQYFYRMKIQQSNSFSEYSNTQTVFTSTLSTPVALASTMVELTSFVANWETLSEATSYRIDVSRDALFTQLLDGYDNLLVNATSLTIPNLEANTIYYYRIRAMNDKAISNHSNVIMTTTTNLTTPTAIPATKVQSGGFQANWITVPNAGSYLLQVAIDEDFTQVLPGYNNLAVANNFKLIQPLEANTTYYFRIKAQGLGAVSDYSNVIQVTTNMLTAPVATAPTFQKAFSFTTNWEIQVGIDIYLLDVATNPSFTNFVVGYQNREVIGGTHTLENLDFNTTYYYRLRSRRLAQTSMYSNVIQVNPCISNNCKVASLAFADPNLISQEFTYDIQRRLTSINFPTIPGDRRTQITYHADGLIDKVKHRYNGRGVFEYTYIYDSKVLKEIQKRDDSNNLVELWTFIYNAQGLRISWAVYSDLLKTTLIERFNYTYNSNNEVVEVREEINGTIRKYTYDEQLSPYALFNPDLCFFITTHRDTWRLGNFLDESAFRGFLPIHNITIEDISGTPSEGIVYSYNSKDIALNQIGFFAGTYTFIGCDF